MTAPSLRAGYAAPALAGIGLVYVYRCTFGLLVPAGTCKYHPSCSEYAIEALRKHGLVKGSAQDGLAPPALQPVVARRCRPPVIGAALLVFSILQPLENAVRWLLDRFHYHLGLSWAWAIVGDHDRASGSCSCR